MTTIIIIILLLIVLGKGGVALGKKLTNNDFDVEKYKLAIGYEESRNKYNIKNDKSGALGYYQFMPSTLNYLKDKYNNLPDWIDENNFLSTPKLQDDYFYKFVADNFLAIIDSGLEKYLGETIKGRLRYPNLTAKLSWYGLQAGAHLGGVGGMKRFLLNIKDADDGNTSISDYCTYFSYKFSNNLEELNA